jgi:hypothetical protein
MQRMLAAAVFCVATLPIAAQTWTEGSIVGVPLEHGKSPVVVYVWHAGLNAVDNIPRKPLPASPAETAVWHTIDLANLAESIVENGVPADAKAIVLQGIAGATGVAGVYCGMVANFRAPGATLHAGNYQIQAIASNPGGSYRENVSITVPVRDRKFEFWWNHNYQDCPMFLTLTVQQYIR